MGQIASANGLMLDAPFFGEFEDRDAFSEGGQNAVLGLDTVVADLLVKQTAGKLEVIIGENYRWKAAARVRSLQHPVCPLAGK